MFSLLPPAFAAVPQYLFHITVELLALTEPDKRLSHTSGSSVRHSVCLRSTTRVQVFADPDFRPVHPRQCLVESFPGVCLALALAVEPFEQDTRCAIDIVAAPLQVVRYGIRGEIGLKKCKECHTSRERFCTKCHEAVSLTPDCYGCHYYP